MAIDVVSSGSPPTASQANESRVGRAKSCQYSVMKYLKASLASLHSIFSWRTSFLAISRALLPLSLKILRSCFIASSGLGSVLLLFLVVFICLSPLALIFLVVFLGSFGRF